MTFWWRDPQGTENRSSIRRVWVYITGVTDHHQNAVPQSMQRIAGTDVWRWSTTLSADWRGSYCFIPSERDDIFASLAVDETPDRITLREGWRQLLPQAIADPLNPVSWKGGGAMRFPRWKCQTRQCNPAGISLKIRQLPGMFAMAQRAAGQYASRVGVHDRRRPA